jgi:hypothetical protein
LNSSPSCLEFILRISSFSLPESLQRAERRLEGRDRPRRADSRRSRLAPEVESRLQALLSGRDRPSMTDLSRDLAAYCRRRRLSCPSRATLYNAIDRARPPAYDPTELPEAVRAALLNVALDQPVPGHQLVFHAFNYGEVAAISVASGMPWLCLHHAARLRGWRPKSRALLQAVMSCRGI